jgi:hypothetical protein
MVRFLFAFHAEVCKRTISLLCPPSGSATCQCLGATIPRARTLKFAVPCVSVALNAGDQRAAPRMLSSALPVAIRSATVVWTSTSVSFSTVIRQREQTGVSMHTPASHEWSFYDAREVCSCGAKRCTATRLNIYSQSVRCRNATRKGSMYCRQHAFLRRSKAKQRSTPAP